MVTHETASMSGMLEEFHKNLNFSLISNYLSRYFKSNYRVAIVMTIFFQNMGRAETKIRVGLY